MDDLKHISLRVPAAVLSQLEELAEKRKQTLRATSVACIEPGILAQSWADENGERITGLKTRYESDLAFLHRTLTAGLAALEAQKASAH